MVILTELVDDVPPLYLAILPGDGVCLHLANYHSPLYRADHQSQVGCPWQQLECSTIRQLPAWMDGICFVTKFPGMVIWLQNINI